jgi:hypothetical protein
VLALSVGVDLLKSVRVMVIPRCTKVVRRLFGNSNLHITIIWNLNTLRTLLLTDDIEMRSGIFSLYIQHSLITCVSRYLGSLKIWRHLVLHFYTKKAVLALCKRGEDLDGHIRVHRMWNRSRVRDIETGTSIIPHSSSDISMSTRNAKCHGGVNVQLETLA